MQQHLPVRNMVAVKKAMKKEAKVHSEAADAKTTTKKAMKAKY